MPANRSTRTLVAAALLVVALFLAMDYVIESTPVLNWWLPLVLVVIGVLMGLSARGNQDDMRATGETSSPTAVREYSFDDAGTIPELAARTSAGPEQPGEVNVREPITEEEVATPVVEVTPGAPAAPPAEEFSTTPVESAPLPTPYRTPQEAEAARRGEDTAQSEMPVSKVEPELPEISSRERLERDGVLLQPADTAENEFQSGEHVAANLPLATAPPGAETTGIDRGGSEALPPEQAVVLEKQAAPEQPHDAGIIAATAPDVVAAITGDGDHEAEASALTRSERIAATPASGIAGQPRDNLTIIHGVGPKIAAALNDAGFDSYAKVAASLDADLESAIRAAGLRFAPTLVTWREQASFLASGDRDGFEALRKRLVQGNDESGD